MDKKLSFAACLVMVAAAASVQAQQTPGVTASTIALGQSAPLTGANAELGNDIRNGALAYFKKVNDAGGSCERKADQESRQPIVVRDHEPFLPAAFCGPA